MTYSDSVRTELAQLTPSAIIELYQLQLTESLHGSNTIYRFHAGTNASALVGPIIWAGYPYAPWPIEARGFDYETKGQLPRPQVRISNIDGQISLLLLDIAAATNGGDLTGARFTRIRTLAKFIDAGNFPGNTNPYGTPDPTAELPREIYYVDRKSAETGEIIEFELASVFDLAGVNIPKGVVINNLCQWQYRRWNGAGFDYNGVDCPYTGGSYFSETDQSVGTPAQDVCGKRLSSCRTRFGGATLPFGAFPGAGTSF
jgi:lambda family phage minor tail protein L